MKTHHLILLIVAVLIAGSIFLWPRWSDKAPSNELVGIWRGQASPEAEYQWWMEYEFKDNGQYTLTTDSSYAEEGTYEITQRFLDGSLLVQKQYNQEKDYVMTVMTLPDDPDTIQISGATLIRQ